MKPRTRNALQRKIKSKKIMTASEMRKAKSFSQFETPPKLKRKAPRTPTLGNEYEMKNVRQRTPGSTKRYERTNRIMIKLRNQKPLEDYLESPKTPNTHKREIKEFKAAYHQEYLQRLAHARAMQEKSKRNKQKEKMDKRAENARKRLERKNTNEEEEEDVVNDDYFK